MRKVFLSAVFCFAASFAFSQTAYNYSTFDYPGATATYPNAISNSGEIVGDYVDSSNVTHGFSYIKGIFFADQCSSRDIYRRKGS